MFDEEDTATDRFFIDRTFFYEAHHSEGKECNGYNGDDDNRTSNNNGPQTAMRQRMAGIKSFSFTPIALQCGFFFILLIFFLFLLSGLGYRCCYFFFHRCSKF